MLLDNESEQNQSCPGAEHPSEGIGYRHNHLENEILKDNNEINRGESHGFASSEQIPDPAFLGGKGLVACSDVEDSIDDIKNGRSKTAPYFFSPAHLEKGGKEPERYMVKAVTQIELPKMIACYKEGPYDITKDIRIDERTRSFDKLLAEKGSEDKKSYDISQIVRDDCMNGLYVSAALKSSSLIGPPISDVKKDKKQWSSGNLLTYDTVDGTVSNEDNEKRVNKRVPSPQDSDLQQFEGSTIDIHSENLEHCSLASLLEEDRVKSDIHGEIVHAYETKELPIPQEFDTRQCCVALSSSGTNLDQPYLFKNDTDKPQSSNGDCEQPQCIKVTRSQCVRCDCTKLLSAVGSTDQLHSVCNSSNEEQAHKTFYHCALVASNSAISAANSEDPKELTSSKDFPVTDKSGSNTMAFDFDSELPATKPKKEIEGVPDFQLLDLATCGAALDDASTAGPGALPQISSNYAGHLVSNLRGPASLSATISYVDHVPYSGSMSLRSDGSAISGRSFAFPILQSEWSSSPVRMERADRRHHGGHRSCWIPRRFCCRF